MGEGERSGVLQVGAAHFQFVAEFFALAGEAVVQFLQRADEAFDVAVKGDVQRSRVGVVGGLRFVDVVVRVAVVVFAFFVAEDFQGTVGDDFVGVHVGGGARPALDHVHQELVVQFAANDFVAGGADGVFDFAVQRADFVVGERGGFFHLCEGVDEGAELVEVHAGDVEVFQGAQGLDAVVGVGGDVAFAE